MRKALFVAIFTLLLVASPAFAQHHGGGGSHNNGGHVQSQPHHDNEGRPVQHESPRSEQQFHQNTSRQGYHYSAPRGEYVQHWNGRRFDHDFFESHWGYRHPFYWSHVGWYGPRWGIGSYFWFDGVYFTIIDPIPAAWYNDSVTVIYDETCGCYYAVDPIYPGIRIHVGVRF